LDVQNSGLTSLLDFEVRNELAEESKKSFDMLEKCLSRTLELFTDLEVHAHEQPAHLHRSNSNSSIHSVIPKQNSSHSHKPKVNSCVESDLSQLRKQFEKASLGEIIARQKRQLNTAETPSAVKITGFSNNLQMISDLLLNRQNAIGQLNEKFSSIFDSLTGKRADDEIWRKTLRIAISNGSSVDSLCPIGPVVGLLSHPSHPISEISRDFVHRLQDLCKSCKDSSSYTQISKEYHQFSFQMIKLLLNNYAEELGNSEALELPLHISMETFVFSRLPALGTMICQCFQEVHAQEDADLLQQFCRLSWMNFEHEDALYAALNVPQKYRLSPAKYEPAIDELRRASSLSCPTSKVYSVVRVCELICSAIEDCKTEDLSIGSEDLIFLLSWTIVQAQLPHMASFFALVSEFIPEELIRGQAGYVLATIQTSIDYIKSIQ
jgi:hypothetical protein